MPKSYILNVEPGNFRIQGGEVEFTVSKITDAVDIESSIPPDAKKAVKDYLIEVLKNIAESTQEIVLNIPSELSQYSDVILELIKSILGA